MLLNYFKTAWRNMRANKAFSLINVLGLSIGLAVCLIILLYIFDETGYERQFAHASQLYRINTSFVSKVDRSKIASSNALLSAGLKTDFPEVEASTRLLTPLTSDGALILDRQIDGSHKTLYEKKGCYVDSNFFDLFNFQFVRGNNRALSRPATAVISESLALSLFDRADPIGKTFDLKMPFGTSTYTVQGVFRRTGPTHIDRDLFLSMKNEDVGKYVDGITNWATGNMFLTYVRLKEGTDPGAFEQKLTPFLRRHGSADIDKTGAARLLSTQAVLDIHLYSKLPYDIGVNGDITYLYILGTIAFFILLIACVNFMNLATARAQKRAREVGIRKVIGALRGSLMAQFLGESMAISLVSLVIALVLVSIFLPMFNHFTLKSLALFDHPSIVGWIAGLTLLTGLLAGLYPAVYLSSFRPIKVLKGQLVNSLSALFFRKGLVVFQFAISVFLILASLVIWQQLNYLQKADLGFQKEQQIVIPLHDAQSSANYLAMKNEMMKHPQVAAVSGGTTYPGMTPDNDLRFHTAGKQQADGVSVPFGIVDYGYLETLGMKMVSGHSFSRDFLGDTSGMIYNETAIRMLGLDPAKAVGTKLYADYNGKTYDFNIIGVVRDFNFKSMRSAIEPFGFQLSNPGQANYIFVRAKTGDYTSLIAALESSWKRLNPGTPFEYSFMDKDFQRTYDNDIMTARIVGCFTALTIFIACLGLFGLAAFTAEQRVREIGIRKVLGCSVRGIATLLSKDFVRLVLIAIVVASPLAWWAMHGWLEGFAYRVTMGWWIFALAGVLAMGIALLTISSQAIRAALANPVKSLRAE